MLKLWDRLVKCTVSILSAWMFSFNTRYQVPLVSVQHRKNGDARGWRAKHAPSCLVWDIASSILWYNQLSIRYPTVLLGYHAVINSSIGPKHWAEGTISWRSYQVRTFKHSKIPTQQNILLRGGNLKSPPEQRQADPAPLEHAAAAAATRAVYCIHSKPFFLLALTPCIRYSSAHTAAVPCFFYRKATTFKDTAVPVLGTRHFELKWSVPASGLQKVLLYRSRTGIAVLL